MKKIILSLLVVLFAPAIFAKEAKENKEFKRDGFLIGFNVGVADFEDKDFIGTSDGYVGLNLGFYVGGSFTQQIALMGLVDMLGGQVDVSGEDVKTTSGVVVAALQYSHPSGFVVRGGPGVAITQASATVGGIEYKAERRGFGFYVGPAYEVYKSGRFAIDVDAKFAPQWYSKKDGGFAYSAGAGIGFSWY